jgi:diguanylate cyclase (GGDEF)-like protein
VSAAIAAASEATRPAPRSAPAPASPVPALPPVQTAPESPAAAPAAAPGVVDAPATPLRAAGGGRYLMTVTALVIMFITAISIATVRAVLTPVRRILRATARVAKGDMQARVPRGGIRELDTLAGAFNEMAARLAEAQAASRSQQESLEETVLQRTHKLQQLAQQDPLTSLPNRRHLSTLLNAAIERADRENRYVGVYFLDIDNFKNFNDSLGHVFGDRVLMSVANRLEEIADGLGFVARLGGDEFTLVYEGAISIEAIQSTGWDLVHAFQKLVSVDDRELSISTSVGASIFPLHEQDADSLLRAADAALFRAKELGRGQLALFTPELTETAARRFSIEQGLRRAIQNSEFELAYQPEINLADSQVGIVEALLRWRMPDGRLAKPAEFLAVAEQSGLISEINDWVLRTALRDASSWYHGGWPNACVAVNISARQLLDQRFVEQLLALTLENKLPANCIELELTEMVLQTGAGTIAALRVLQSAGFGIVLDDFGTGYSSLTSLEQLPLSRIKLDRSLIAGIDTSTRSAAIARAIIDLCEGLGLPVTAEGVERPEQFAWLLGCRAMYLQGYLLSDAVPFADVLRVKASLANKVHDLMLSLPAPSHRRSPIPIQARGSAGR